MIVNVFVIIKLWMLLLRLMLSSIPILMVSFCYILVCIALSLRIWFISLTLVHILCMLLVNLLFLLLQFIGWPLFAFWYIFRGYSFIVFYFHLIHSWSYMHIVMLIGGINSTYRRFTIGFCNFSSIFLRFFTETKYRVTIYTIYKVV